MTSRAYKCKVNGLVAEVLENEKTPYKEGRARYIIVDVFTKSKTYQYLIITTVEDISTCLQTTSAFKKNSWVRKKHKVKSLKAVVIQYTNGDSSTVRREFANLENALVHPKSKLTR